MRRDLLAALCLGAMGLCLATSVDSNDLAAVSANGDSNFEDASVGCAELHPLLSKRNNSACHCHVDSTEWIGCSNNLMPDVR